MEVFSRRLEGWERGFLCELGALRRSRARDRNFWMGFTGLTKRFSRRGRGDAEGRVAHRDGSPYPGGSFRRFGKSGSLRTIRPTLDTGDFRFRDLEGGNGREQDDPATIGMCCADEEEVLTQRPGDTKEEGLNTLNHEERREHEGWRWGSSICGNLRHLWMRMIFCRRFDSR